MENSSVYLLELIFMKYLESVNDLQYMRALARFAAKLPSVARGLSQMAASRLDSAVASGHMDRTRSR
jgi:hypothetical protein